MTDRIGAAALSEAQTFLFVPANRPDRFDKAVHAGADITILDLEDAVPAADKAAARAHARSWLTRGGTAVVRINGADTLWHAADVDMVVTCGAPVILPKAESPAPVANLASQSPDVDVIALVESARGVAAAEILANTPHVRRLAFGSVDLATQLGVDPDDRCALLLARSSLVHASAAGGLAPPIDGVTTKIADAQRVYDDVRFARRLGMQAKLCIHPTQLAPVRQAFAPTSDEIAWAHAVLAATSVDGAAIAVDGTMVDRPVVLRAQQIITHSTSWESADPRRPACSKEVP